MHGLHTPWWTFNNNSLAPKMLIIVSLSWEKEDFSPFQYWRDMCKFYLVKWCRQIGFLPCIQNDIFSDLKKHLPSPIGKTFISNCKDASLDSYTFKNHPRTLEQKVQCMVPTPCSWTFEKFQGHCTTQRASPYRQMYHMEWWMLFSRCLPLQFCSGYNHYSHPQNYMIHDQYFIQNFIDERKWVVILLGAIIKFSVVDTYS